VTYFKKLDVAVAIQGTSLVAVQLEAPKSRKRKRKVEGLLIDSIGRGIPQAVEISKGTQTMSKSLTSYNYLPGSMSEKYWKRWKEDETKADELLQSKDLAGFDKLLARKFNIELVQMTNGNHDSTMANGGEAELPEWKWPADQASYPRVDRRWILYAITRVFSLQKSTPGQDSLEVKLSCQLPQTNVLHYLISGGHLTVPNLKSAFIEAAREVDELEVVLSEQMPQVLADLDPKLELLLAYLSATKLGPIELLSSIRLIMQSLDLVQDPTKQPQKLITQGEEAEEDEAIGMNLDRLEEALEITEYHLLDDMSTRARGLTVAFGLLATCSSTSTVLAIRRLFRPAETLSLIHVLRVELVKGGWTTRYLDTSHLDSQGNADDDDLEAPADGSIQLIADLLCRCIDSVGPGGWAINDAILSRAGDHLDSADLLGALKLEVSAALEGIQEAVYLRGILSETARYGAEVQKAQPTWTSTNNKKQPIRINLPTRESRMLPMGLKTPWQPIEKEKIVAGGEMIQRTKREKGQLISQKVGAYSLERIVI
jgi:hypothetical protein